MLKCCAAPDVQIVESRKSLTRVNIIARAFYQLTACSAVVAVSGLLSHGSSSGTPPSISQSFGGAPHAAAYAAEAIPVPK